MATFIDLTAHGLTTDDAIYFSNVSPSYTGLEEGATFYVLAAGLTADTFQFSETIGGAPYDFDPVDEATVNTVEEWAVLDDDEMNPPVAPDAPGSCVLSSAATIAEDGTIVTRLTVTITQPTNATLRHTIVTITGGSNTEQVVIPVGQTTGSIVSVVPGVSYTGSAVAYDTFGLYSTATVSSAHVAAGDVTPPAVPADLVVTGAVLGLIIRWTSVSDLDIDHYDVAISDDVGVTYPTVHAAYSNVMALMELTPGDYYVKVRAVDRSGNASAYGDPEIGTSRLTDEVAESLALTLKAPRVVNSLPELPSGQFPEGTLVYLTTDFKLYRSLGDTWSKAVDGADIIANSITAGTIAAGAIGAEALAAEIVLASLIKTSDGPNRLEFDEDGLRAYQDDLLTAEIGPSGVLADSLRIGNLGGGHNLIPNSSFELAAFATGATTAVFTDNSGTPGWKAANRTTAIDNITENATTLTATTVAY